MTAVLTIPLYAGRIPTTIHSPADSAAISTRSGLEPAGHPSPSDEPAGSTILRAVACDTITIETCTGRDCGKAYALPLLTATLDGDLFCRSCVSRLHDEVAL